MSAVSMIVKEFWLIVECFVEFPVNLIWGRDVPDYIWHDFQRFGYWITTGGCGRNVLRAVNWNSKMWKVRYAKYNTNISQ